MQFYKANFISSNIDATGVPFHLWHFTSSKTRRKYIVIVEQYQNNIFSVKFYPRQYKNNPLRYSVLTGDYEPRTIVMTVIQIMIWYAREYKDSSFVIIGSSSENESKSNTKRFRFYQRMICEYFDDTIFTHVIHKDISLYMMLRNSEVNNGNIDRNDIVEFIDSTFYTDQ